MSILFRLGTALGLGLLGVGSLKRNQLAIDCILRPLEKRKRRPDVDRRRGRANTGVQACLPSVGADKGICFVYLLDEVGPAHL